MLRTVGLFLLLVTFATSGVSATFAEKRVALVVGNSAYMHATVLKNPKTDANAVADLFGRLGFEVVVGTDLSMREFADTVNAFSDRLSGADVALFYYAGHGLQVHGRNYLAPIDAKLRHEAGLEFEAVQLSSILALMERRHRTNLIFLDACRDNPLASKLARSMGTRSSAVGRGLARLETGIGTLIAFATQPGNVALDGDKEHSPFTEALLNHSETPGLDIEGLMRRVRSDVIRATGGSQVPWSHSSLTSRFMLKAGEGNTQITQTDYPHDAKMAALKRELQALKKQVARHKKTTSDIKVAKLTKPETTPAATPEVAKVRDSREVILALQKELKRVGCDPGAIDGIWGRKGRNALSKFAKHTKLSLPTGKPTMQAVAAVKRRKNRACPITKQTHNNKELKDRKNKNKIKHKNENKSGKIVRMNSFGHTRAKCFRDIKNFCKSKNVLAGWSYKYNACVASYNKISCNIKKYPHIRRQ